MTAGTDALADWMKNDDVAKALVLNEDASESLVAKVTDEGYATDLTDVEVVEIGRDPFLISYGLAQLGNRTIVTTEVSKPTAQRANRRIPDVCKQFGIPCCDTFQMIGALNFSTGWNK